MAYLVAQHPREFSFVVQVRQQATADIHIAARGGEGVDHLGVEHGERELHVGLVAVGHELLADPVDVGLQLRVIINLPRVHQFLVLLGADGDFFALGHDDDIGSACGRVAGAARQQREHQARGAQAAVNAARAGYSRARMWAGCMPPGTIKTHWKGTPATGPRCRHRRYPAPVR